MSISANELKILVNGTVQFNLTDPLQQDIPQDILQGFPAKLTPYMAIW